MNASPPSVVEIRSLTGGRGVTDDELDFILNYDIKYLLGRSMEEEE
jgi:hypothetical protein